jgi:hypothetical protein
MYVLAGADAIAALIDADVTVVPFDTVLQAVVTHCARFVGIPPTTPAWDQSIAREGSRIPDHAWPYKNPVKQKMTKTIGGSLNVDTLFSGRTEIKVRLDRVYASAENHRKTQKYTVTTLPRQCPFGRKARPEGFLSRRVGGTWPGQFAGLEVAGSVTSKAVSGYRLLATSGLAGLGRDSLPIGLIPACILRGGHIELLAFVTLR